MGERARTDFAGMGRARIELFTFHYVVSAEKRKRNQGRVCWIRKEHKWALPTSFVLAAKNIFLYGFPMGSEVLNANLQTIFLRSITQQIYKVKRGNLIIFEYQDQNPVILQFHELNTQRQLHLIGFQLLNTNLSADSFYG